MLCVPWHITSPPRLSPLHPSHLLTKRLEHRPLSKRFNFLGKVFQDLQEKSKNTSVLTSLLKIWALLRKYWYILWSLKLSCCFCYYLVLFWMWETGCSLDFPMQLLFHCFHFHWEFPERESTQIILMIHFLTISSQQCCGCYRYFPFCFPLRVPDMEPWEVWVLHKLGFIAYPWSMIMDPLCCIQWLLLGSFHKAVLYNEQNKSQERCLLILLNQQLLDLAG